MKQHAAMRPAERVGAGITAMTLALDQSGAASARIDYNSPPEGAHAIRVDVDGTLWAVIPALPVDGAQNARSVTFSLPRPSKRGIYDIVLRSSVTGDLIGRQEVRAGDPVQNSYGLSAQAVLSLDVAPMFSVPWLSFDGAELVISGAHLPPCGNPGDLSIGFDDGVDWALEYPLASPEFGAHYWYWPNAHWSGFRLRINLAASAPESNPFTFRFESSAGTTADPEVWPDRARIWLPADLRAFVGYPTDGSQLTRVQTWSEQKTVTLTGYNSFRAMESLLFWHGIKYSPGMHVLDWGCGHGRIARHFIREWPEAHIMGADIDAENIHWCSQSLTGGTFLTAPLWPPMAVPDGTFDAIFGLSVMTHLTADAQRAWLNEIHRILKPGGVALISFGGDGAAAYASIHHTPDWWNSWIAQGFDDGLHDPALNGKIADASYYRITHQNAAQVRQAWHGRLTIVAIEHQAFGYQDVAVLKRTND